MLLAAPALPPLLPMLYATVGIALVAGAAAAFNCLVEQKLDAVMARTRDRPTVMGSITTAQILLMSGAVGGLGIAILWHAVNPLTMWLTLGTFVGYAIVYTVILKPATPQNIVIGGASGAMPPVLGWAAITGDVPYQPLLLFLIIFAWTPPHFWALALYRRREYARAGIPMLPVTHGEAYTRLHLLLYTLIMVATTLLPFATGMAGLFYLGCALVLDAVFLVYAVAIYVSYTDTLAKRTFSYSIFYLAMIFAALMVDHYLPMIQGR
jgi:protoheme IX farnesyltransferase